MTALDHRLDRHERRQVASQDALDAGDRLDAAAADVLHHADTLLSLRMNGTDFTDDWPTNKFLDTLRALTDAADRHRDAMQALADAEEKAI